MTQDTSIDLHEHAPQHAAKWRRERIYYLDWAAVSDSIDEIYRQAMSQQYHPSVVLGIARGGLVPAVCLSNRFGCTNLRVISVARTETDNLYSRKHAPGLAWMSSPMDLDGERVLIVDDIAGAGATLAFACAKISSLGVAEIRTATLVANCECAIRPNFYALSADDWVIFPWETMDSGASRPVRIAPVSRS